MLTLAFQAFGLCHVIQFLLRPRSAFYIPLHFRSFQSAPGFAAVPRPADSSLSQIPASLPDCPAVLPPGCRRISRGEKIPHGGGPAVLTHAAETLTNRGEGCKEPRRRGPELPRAQASASFLRDQRRRSGLFLLISDAVLRLWQRWHRLWRLFASVNTAQSPLWSRMWSTSVALIRMPC